MYVIVPWFDKHVCTCSLIIIFSFDLFNMRFSLQIKWQFLLDILISVKLLNWRLNSYWNFSINDCCPVEDLHVVVIFF